MQKPPPTKGLHHIALFVADLEACEKFYTELLNMQVEWRPDENNLYLTSGSDNLALHRMQNTDFSGKQRLDHIGFIINKIEEVDVWYEFFKQNNVKIKLPPKTHRDGARSFYCEDPAGNIVQMIYHPPLATPTK